jgi:tetratricopeptide (TPR) repeat protein
VERLGAAARDRWLALAEDALAGLPPDHRHERMMFRETLAFALYRAGQFEALVEQLNAAVKEAQGYPRRWQVVVFAQTGRYLSSVLLGAHDYPQSWNLLLALAHHRLGQGGQGQHWVKQAVAALPRKRHYLGWSFERVRKEAEAVFGVHLEAQPGPAKPAVAGGPGWQYYVDRAGAYLQLREHDKALADCARAIELGARGHQVWARRASAYAQLGQWDKAAANYQQAIRLGAEDGDIHADLGVALHRQGKRDEAITAFRRASVLKPDNANTYFNLGLILSQQGKLEEAGAAYRRVIALKPGHALAHNNLGIVLRGQGKLDQAVAEWRKALRLEPNNTAPLWNLSSVLANGPDPMLRDPRQAIELAKRGIALQDNAWWWQTLGWAHYRAGAWKDCIAALEKSIALYPAGADADQWLFLAMAHGQLGHKEEARRWYDRAAQWIERNKEAIERDRPNRLVGDVYSFRAEAARVLGMQERKKVGR